METPLPLALMGSAITALATSIGALPALAANRVSERTQDTLILPWALAFAGGAMVYVVSDEIIPESHHKEHAQFATAGLMVGFVLMMVLDTALG